MNCRLRNPADTARLVIVGLLAAMFLVLLPAAEAQVRRHDPLTEEETDQLRESAQQPEQRFKLLLEFTKLRLAALDQPLKAVDAAGRGMEIHDHLDDFTLLYDELEDNITQYLDRKEDLRKPLRLIIGADEEFAARLRHMREVVADPKASPDTIAEAREYAFILTNATEAVSTGLTDHRKLLQEQEQLAKDRKKRK